MSEVRVNNLTNENNTGGPTISGITTYSGRHFFVPPQGDTASRPSDCEPGSLRFNTDSAKLEYFKGNLIGWVEIEANSNNGGGNPEGRGSYIGFIAGGNDPNPWTGKNSIDYVTITTYGSSVEFGDMQVDKTGHNAICNDIRILFPGGYRGNGYQNSITFNQVQSKGNGVDFGDLLGVKLAMGTVNNKTRGIIGTGQNSNGSPYNTDVIENVTIAQQGDSVDFGDGQNNTSNACSSSTRGLFARDSNSPAEIIYITMSTLGNTQDFGDVTGHRAGGGGASSATRCIWSGNYFGNNISYMTMATLGDSIDFGDLDVSRDDPIGMSSPTRAVLACGRTIPAYRGINTMSTIQIATTGNGVFFGDITYMGAQDDNTQNIFGGSNGHGGLSG